MATFEATAISTSDTGLTVKARNFEFLVDEPPSLGGGDLGPNPVEYMLGALLGCLNVMVHLAAKEQGVTLTSFSATARGDLDPSKFLGKNLDVRAGYQNVEVNIEVEGDVDADKLAEIARIAESRCPVSDNIANTTPVTIKIVKKA
ncbi:OsmC family protein [Demequina lutea]|uniref:Putative OsmC-like protein n=1 Tax=Demequina lutea TaxID=431489 RepID=A0A7Z0CJK8_9MICO|nr:OsmC family protein [Demequina lutea]NYI40860.1 putative OsmC-like protein [Demequina lutea]